MINKTRMTLLLLGMMTLLVACGNKGDLYIPDKQDATIEENSD
ncbi:MAG: lipoprotein [Marinicella sp.]|nr:lipoprotein [Xanthomonadales bacterium]